MTAIIDWSNMWLLVFLFLLNTLMIAWSMFGYYMFIWLYGVLRFNNTPVFPSKWPRLSVIVPMFNEEAGIEAKLNNIRELDYPRESLEVVFVDGGSTDGGLDILTRALGEEESYIRIIRACRPGKTNQINEALPTLDGDIVVNTDVDAMLEPDALKWLAAEFAMSDDVRVVGAFVKPATSIEVEHYYWDAQNKGRLMESEAGFASIVIAPCYAFKRNLINVFPDDVVADDVYVAYLANTLGYKTVYSRKAHAVETRTPQSYRQFVAQKFRKSNAVLRESLRFFYLLPDMRPLFRLVTLTRVAQQALLPWAALLWLMMAGSLMTMPPFFRYDIVIYGVALLVAALLVTTAIFSTVQLPGEEKKGKYSPGIVIRGYMLTMFILLATGVTYSFYRQGSSFARMEEAKSG